MSIAQDHTNGFRDRTGTVHSDKPIRGAVCEWWYVQVDDLKDKVILPFRIEDIEVIDE